jgi:serine/threonine protein kinase
MDKPEEIRGQTSALPSPTAAISAWQPGQVIDGQYEVKKLLGKGAMGEVHLVYHRLWKVQLAVKAPLPKIMASEKTAERFLREARLWINMGKHPNIVTAWYVKKIAGLLRIFVEYVNGWDLKTYLRGGMIADLAQALDIAIQITSGMRYAHEQCQLVHRDLKSSNILMSQEGEAKVTDFGLAKAIDAADIVEDEVRSPISTPQRQRVPKDHRRQSTSASG